MKPILKLNYSKDLVLVLTNRNLSQTAFGTLWSLVLTRYLLTISEIPLNKSQSYILFLSSHNEICQKPTNSMAFLFNNLYSALLLTLLIFPLIQFNHSLSTISISETLNQTLICALIKPSNQKPFLNCTSFPQGIQIPINPNASLVSATVAGNGFLCALKHPYFSPTSVLTCWRFSINGTNMHHKRIYRGTTIKELVSGNSQICGLVGESSLLGCWQWRRFHPRLDQKLSSIAVGENFLCGLVSESWNITCTGNNSGVVGHQPSGMYKVVAAGFSHACAISVNNCLDCWGDMKGRKPQGKFTSLALGENRSCGLRLNGTVVCWGENNFNLPERLKGIIFIGIEAKRSIFCGVLSSNFSLYCWGNENFDSNFMVFKDSVQPSPCKTKCPCKPLPGYQRFCEQGLICQPCEEETHSVPPSPESFSPPPQPYQQAKTSVWSKKNIIFLVIGCLGSVSFISVSVFFLFRFFNFKPCQVHDSGPLDQVETRNEKNQAATTKPPVLEKRLSHLMSVGDRAHLEEFSWEVLIEATDNFSEAHKIGMGSFGSVYHGKLEDGREVAIKRAEIPTSASYAIHIAGDDKDNAFLNELESLSRLNHKNLVRLHGFFEDNKERILVYEYMKNGTLYDHLHKLENSPLISWTERIRVALDAARGIEYLHVYTVPSIIHRDIKSSNILLDENLTAKVCDFGLSLMGPEDENSHLSLLAAGTFGYMDPEYYRLQQLTAKSDVYSFGVVLLELLSGYKAIHKNENGIPRNVVDFVIPFIVHDEIHRVLDQKFPPPTPFEIEAVVYVGYLAVDCVALEGRDRPSMTEIVSSLERALAACLARPVLSRSTTDSST